MVDLQNSSASQPGSAARLWRTWRARTAVLALALVLATPMATLQADARAGGGFSFGSRGTRSFSMPPTTMTAPRPAAPFQSTEAPRPGLNGFAPAGQPRRFGFGSGLAAGLLGAGLFGLLTGNGFFGGLGGLSSLIGFLFQMALVGGLVWLALNFFRSRIGGPMLAAGPASGPSYGPRPNGPAGGGFAGRPGGAPITIGPQDYAAFERALGDIQNQYGREDRAALSRLVTPEMLRHFDQEIDANRRQGVRNAITDTKLLQGDLSEAWREGTTDYATVAMRFGAKDVMVDRATGQVVAGEPDRMNEATELWTFGRDRGGPWLLSAIQQVG